jgi:Uma2 family endonuclease
MSLPYPAELYNGMDKVDAYLQQGSRIVLLVFPTTREVLICTPEEKRSVRDVLTLPNLLPGFELKIEDILWESRVND